jgi:hypothetical protein
LIPPPPIETTAEPTRMARTAYHRPVTIRGAIFSWSSAAKAPKTRIAIPAPLAMIGPPETLLSRLDNRSLTALAIAAAITTIKMATRTLGR